jgi:hypothetical protein
LAHGLLLDTAPAVAGSVLLGGCFAERTLRVRSRRWRMAHLAVAFVCGAFAGYLGSRFSGEPWWVWAVVISMAAVLSCLPLLIEADDPVADVLDATAEQVHEPARTSLAAGAELRRSVDESLLEPAARRQVADTWKNLLRLSEARLRLERSTLHQVSRGSRVDGAAEHATCEPAYPPAAAVLDTLDELIAEHVAGLTTAYVSADAANAASVSLNDLALRSVQSSSEIQTEMSRLLVDRNGDQCAHPRPQVQSSSGPSADQVD